MPAGPRGRLYFFWVLVGCTLIYLKPTHYAVWLAATLLAIPICYGVFMMLTAVFLTRRHTRLRICAEVRTPILKTRITIEEFDLPVDVSSKPHG